MTFVFPALLGALAAAGIPVLLHLILRQKPKTLPFPAFRFLVARHRSNQRKLQLRHLLLLILRIILLAGLILAIARPRLLDQNLGLSSERPVAAVLVFDVSPSMDYRSADNRTRLDDAKGRALELLDQLPIGSRVEIMTTSDSPSGRGEWLVNLAQARQRIGELRIQPASPTVDRAIAAGLRHFAELALQRSDEASARLPRLLAIFTDTTRGASNRANANAVDEASDAVPPPREALQAARSELLGLLALTKEGPEKYPRITGLEQHLRPLQKMTDDLQDRIPRLSPAEFPLKEQSAEMVRDLRQIVRECLKLLAPTDPSAKIDEDANRWSLALRKVLRNTSGYEALWFDVGMDPLIDLAIVRLEWPQRGGETVEAFAPDDTVQLRVVVEAAGQDFQTTLECIHSKGKIVRPIEVKAGQSTVVPFDLPLDELKLGHGYHALEFKLDVRDSWAGNNRRFATFLVREPKKVWAVGDRALDAEHVFLAALRANRLEAESKSMAQAEEGIATGIDAVYLFAMTEPSESLWRVLDAYVRAGGSVGIVPGGVAMKSAAYKTESAQKLMPAEWKSIVELKGKDAGVGWSWQPEAIFRHPILKPFERWRLDSNIDFVKFPPRASRFWEVHPNKEAETLVNYADEGRPALVERRVGAGKLLQFTTPLDIRQPSWNNYLEKSFYVVLAGLATKYLTGEAEAVRCNFVAPIEEPTVPARGLTGRKLLLQGVEPVNVPAEVMRFSVPGAVAPDNYRLRDGDKTAAAFSVNLTPEEVAPARMAKADIENVFGADTVLAGDRKADFRQLLQGHWHEPIELYPYLMVAILMLLAFENLLANRFYRQPEDAL